MKPFNYILFLAFALTMFASCRKDEAHYEGVLVQQVSDKQALFLYIDGNNLGMIPYNNASDFSQSSEVLKHTFGYGRYVVKIQDVYGDVKSSFILRLHPNKIDVNTKTGGNFVSSKDGKLYVSFLGSDR